MKEPVRTIRSFAQAICNGEIEGSTRDQYMRHICEAGVRMTVLIDTVLSYTQLGDMEEVPREVFGLEEAVASASANLSVLSTERGTSVDVDALPAVTGNRIQIIQVLQNLMSNAVNHSVRPVHIRISGVHDGQAVRIIPAARRADWYERGVGGAAAFEINKIPAAVDPATGQQ